MRRINADLDRGVEELKAEVVDKAAKLHLAGEELMAWNRQSPVVGAAMAGASERRRREELRMWEEKIYNRECDLKLQEDFFRLAVSQFKEEEARVEERTRALEADRARLESELGAARADNANLVQGCKKLEAELAECHDDVEMLGDNVKDMASTLRDVAFWLNPHIPSWDEETTDSESDTDESDENDDAEEPNVEERGTDTAVLGGEEAAEELPEEDEAHFPEIDGCHSRVEETVGATIASWKSNPRIDVAEEENWASDNASMPSLQSSFDEDLDNSNISECNSAGIAKEEEMEEKEEAGSSSRIANDDWDSTEAILAGASSETVSNDLGMDPTEAQKTEENDANAREVNEIDIDDDDSDDDCDCGCGFKRYFDNGVDVRVSDWEDDDEEEEEEAEQKEAVGQGDNDCEDIDDGEAGDDVRVSYQLQQHQDDESNAVVINAALILLCFLFVSVFRVLMQICPSDFDYGN